MKSVKLYALCLCTTILLSTTACDIIGSEDNADFNILSSYVKSGLISDTESKPGASNERTESAPKSSVTEATTKNVTSSWVNKAPMLTPRYSFGTEVIDGKIYVFGGRNKSGNLSSTEMYDPKSNKWIEMKSMSAQRSSFQTVVLSGKIYAIGGSVTGDGGIGVSVPTVERYDPAVNVWTVLKRMNTERKYYRLAVIDEKIYAIGGSADSSVQSSVEVYDSVLNTWTEKAPMSIRRMQFGLEIIGGKIYVIGGCSPNQATNALETVEMYDPAKNKWTKKASMKTPRFSFQTEVVDGKIYAIGGLSIKTGDLPYVEVYDPATDQWTAKKPMHIPRSWFQTAVVNGKIIAIGGWKKVGDYLSTSLISSVEEYDPKSDTWTEKEPILPARTLFQAVTVDGEIYAIGGAVGSDTQFEPGTALVEEYTAVK